MATSTNVSINSDGTYTLDVSESSTSTETTASSSLGKEDFLLLLVTQMQYQDPLDPMDDTEYVAQLAQFSTLEEMINLNETMSNGSAYDLTGKTVVVSTTSSTGSTENVEGVVDYVTIQNGDAYLSIDGTLYEFENLVTVYDEDYLISLCLPSVSTQSLTFSHVDQQNVKVTGIDMGSDDYEASSLAVVIIDSSGNMEAVDTDYLSYSGGTLTIDKEAFASLTAGTYSLALVFDDANSTVDYTSVTLTVTGSVTTTSTDETEETDDEETTETEETDETDETKETEETEETDEAENDGTETEEE